MIALDDAALARLCIGASRIAPARRGPWLRQLAERIDPPPRNIVARRERSRRAPARRRQGTRVYRFVLSDRTIEGVINGLIATGRLTEAQVDYAAIESALEQMLTAWASHWT